MKLISRKSNKIDGMIELPPSKSHTVRAVVVALLADGTSIIKKPLNSGDGLSALTAAESLGAKIEQKEDEWIIQGTNGNPIIHSDKIDIGNSGTSLRMMVSIAALQEKEIIFDGDSSIKKRPMQPLIDSLNNLGASVFSENGSTPIKVSGPITGGKTDVDGRTSQYLSSLLLACPLAKEKTELTVDNLNESPYVEMTLKWLDEQHINYTNNDMKKFVIEPNQNYNKFEKIIPADWSAAAFPICAATATKSSVILKGLDINDVQGDKKIIDFIKCMGAKIEINIDEILVDVSNLKGIEIDLNACPDMLPALSVMACFAKGITHLKNVPQARIKECDRIKVMREELSKLGADIGESKDGLIIHESKLSGGLVDGHKDHRVIMALSCAGMGSSGTVEIENADNLDVSFPDYIKKMNSLGADLKYE